MGRLIDEDDLIENIKGSEELLDFQKDECIACIEACDTAYNPKKVMEEIKDYARRVYGEIVTVQVLKIVRRGGKD